MKFSTFAIILALLSAFFGIALLVIPVKFMSTYGIVLDNTGVLIARLFGALLIGNGITWWLCRYIPPSDKVWQYILVGTIFYNAVAVPITASAALNGISNSTGWTTPAVQLLVVISSLYYLLQKKTEARFA